ncbi:MAG: hypothetical protein JXR37_18215 [Kiritimatiellae bacterium]|nr:hypothetical protein [Kiritimatiellia bacterium]
MKYHSTVAMLSLLAWCLGTPSGGHAAVVDAASCSREDVAAAIAAAETGDVVAVPAGSGTWDKALGVPDGKKITLQGDGPDATIITYKGGGAGVYLGRSGSRLTGCKIILPEGTKGHCVQFYGDGCRVDHCEFENFNNGSRMGVFVRGLSKHPDPTGLIDNCLFRNTRVYVHGDASLTAHRSWHKDYKVGSADFLFVEDCVFARTRFGNSIDLQYGGNYVFRHNIVSNSCVEVHSAYRPDGEARAGRLWEVYGNTFIATISTYAPFRLRGGTGVVYDNVVKGGKYGNPNILIDNVRSYPHPRRQGEIYCKGANGTRSDMRTADGTYIARDQIGRGRDQWLWTKDKPYPPQAADPVYAWNNTNGETGKPVAFEVINGCQLVLIEGRDYIHGRKPGYVPYPYPHPMRKEARASGDARAARGRQTQ